jgi:putative acetyltransferase
MRIQPIDDQSRGGHADDRGAMSGIAIREERASDRAAVRAVVEQAFGSRYEADMVEQLHADGDVIAAFVAVADGRIVGHVLFSPLGIEGGPGSLVAASLAPLAVAPDRPGQGIGSALVCRGLEACRAASIDAVFVLGDPAYYRRFGFDSAAALRFETPFPGEAFMALALKRGALDGAAGTVHYARAFGLDD